ncbi:MAG: rhodanese-like domain-containing protein [Myxococcales bacterium]|nr:rhodanese-like domain-containing protein [Myxococcales bacterium]
MLLRIALFVALLVAAYLLFFRGGDVRGVDARRLVAEGGRLVDVRSREEYAAGHIEGATNIPIQELEGRMEELAPKDQPIVVYCQSGGRSRRAAELLKSAGYSAVHNLGGMRQW